MSTVAISTPFNISLDFEIAEFHKRLVAYFIDLVIQIVYIIAMQYCLPILFDFMDFMKDTWNNPVYKLMMRFFIVFSQCIIIIVLVTNKRSTYIKASKKIIINAVFILFEIIWILCLILMLSNNMDKEIVTDNGGLYIFFVGIPVLLYHLVMEVLNNGQSLGKMAMGIRVMSLEGGEPHLGQYMMRWIFRVFEWLPMLLLYTSWIRYNFVLQAFMTGVLGLIVVLIVAINKNSQRFGDMTAGTTVVNTKVKLGLSDTVFREVTVKDYKVTFPDVMRLSDRDINAIKAVLNQSQKSNRYDTAHRVAYKVKEVLKIESNLEVTEFLEKLLEDYNYLATKE
jgi:uncharacterized RDD family membrane protein YckC